MAILNEEREVNEWLNYEQSLEYSHYGGGGGGGGGREEVTKMRGFEIIDKYISFYWKTKVFQIFQLRETFLRFARRPIRSTPKENILEFR